MPSSQEITSYVCGSLRYARNGIRFRYQGLLIRALDVIYSSFDIHFLKAINPVI